MTARSRRDYSLSGGMENVTPLDDEIIEERMAETWWSPDIPRADLKVLMERKDGPALWHFGLWIILLAVSGYLAWISWGTWWAIPAFLVFGTIYSSNALLAIVIKSVSLKSVCPAARRIVLSTCCGSNTSPPGRLTPKTIACPPAQRSTSCLTCPKLISGTTKALTFLDNCLILSSGKGQTVINLM